MVTVEVVVAVAVGDWVGVGGTDVKVAKGWRVGNGGKVGRALVGV